MTRSFYSDEELLEDSDEELLEDSDDELLLILYTYATRPC